MKRALAGLALLGGVGFFALRWATESQGAPPRPATRLQGAAEALRRGDLSKAARIVEAMTDDTSTPLAEQYAARLRLRSLIEKVPFDQSYEGALSVPGIADLITTPGSAAPAASAPEACARPADFAAPFVYLRPAPPTQGFVEALDDLFAQTGRHPRVVTDATWPAGARRVAVSPVGPFPAEPPPAGVAVTWLGPSPAAAAHLGLAPPAPLFASGCRLVGDDPRLGGLARWSVPVPVIASAAHLEGVPPERVLATLRCGGADHPGIVWNGDAAAPAVMFAFDALAALVHLRQGDPGEVGKENDQTYGLRPSDLFTPARTRAQLMVPVADLFGDAVVRLVEGPGVAPRLWPHPAGTNGALVITTDQDFAPAPQVMAMLAALRAASIPATVFLTSAGLNQEHTQEPVSPSPEVVALARTWGFDFAAHTFVRERPADMAPDAHDPTLDNHAAALKQLYGIEPVLIRQHAVLWSGYVDRARDMVATGYRWEADYLTVVGKTLPTLGYMTGSARPLRLFDEAGAPLPIRQVATQLDDHPDPAVPVGARTMDGQVVKLPPAVFLGDTLQLVAENARHFHGALVLNNHPIFFTRSPDWLMRTVAAARASGQAVMSLQQYVQQQEAVMAGDVAVSADGRSFSVCAAADAQEVVLVGAPDAPDAPVRVDGVEVAPRRAIREGRPVAVLTLARGPHRIDFAVMSGAAGGAKPPAGGQTRQAGGGAE